MTPSWFDKDPDEVLDYSWPVPLDEGDTISGTPTAAILSGTITMAPVAVADGAVTLTLSGGEHGETAQVQILAVTAGGRTFEKTINVRIFNSAFRRIDLALAKQHLQYEDDDRDTLISQYIDAAQGWVENFTGKLLSRRSVTRRVDTSGPYYIVGIGPDPVIESITYLDADAVEQTIDASGYLLAGGRVYPRPAWPHAPYGLEATIKAGFAADVPAELISAQLLLVGHWFANREAVVVVGATIPHDIPLTVESLCWPHRSLFV